MRKIVIFFSVVCGLAAIISLIMGINVLRGTNHGFMVNLRLFRLAEKGNIVPFIGNLVGTAIYVVGFGIMALYGFSNSQQAKKNGFIYGLIMSGVCFVSLIAAIVSKDFNMGHVYILFVPVAYTIAILKSA